MTETEPRRRAEDLGVVTRIWDAFDARDVDKHLMSWMVFAVTIWIVWWATHFVENHPDKPGLEVAAMVGAVMVPWTPLQAAVVNWYFRARQ